jgi:hypothetical protein
VIDLPLENIDFYMRNQFPGLGLSGDGILVQKLQNRLDSMRGKRSLKQSSLLELSQFRDSERKSNSEEISKSLLE